MSLDLSYAFNTLIKYWPMFWYGIRLTLAFAIVGTLGGFVIGLLVGAIRGMAEDPLDSGFTKFLKQVGRVISGLYIWIFRGTPMMIQAVFLYYLLRPVLNWTPITAGMIIISINTGAYMAEIIRSGLQSVDPGQTEAAKSIGMNNFQTLMFVIFPQAIKNTFPSIGNQLIVNIKDSCMLNAIAVTELYFQTTSVAGTNMRYVEVYLVSAILYLCLTTLATWLLNFIERRINHTSKVSTKEFSA